MAEFGESVKHDAYASTYDREMKAYDCYITDGIFGLLFEFTLPGQILLDAGIGTGLSSQLFAKAGLEIHGMDFSPAMLDICRAKGIAVTLQQQDILHIPWPYEPNKFDHLVCCGVMHFLPELEAIFSEAKRILRPGGYFAFTTKVMAQSTGTIKHYTRQLVGDFDIFTHTPEYIGSLLGRYDFNRIKQQKCFVGEDVFNIQVAQKKHI